MTLWERLEPTDFYCPSLVRTHIGIGRYTLWADEDVAGRRDNVATGVGSE